MDPIPRVTVTMDELSFKPVLKRTRSCDAATLRRAQLLRMDQVTDMSPVAPVVSPPRQQNARRGKAAGSGAGATSRSYPAPVGAGSDYKPSQAPKRTSGNAGRGEGAKGKSVRSRKKGKQPLREKPQTGEAAPTNERKTPNPKNVPHKQPTLAREIRPKDNAGKTPIANDLDPEAGLSIQMDKAVPTHMRPWLRELFPDCKIKYPIKRGRCHHPISSTIRAVLETQAVSGKRGTILIPGARSTLRRVAAMNLENKIHVCQPLLNDKDRYYYTQVYPKLEGNITYCSHLMSECDCVEPDLIVLVNVLYYLTMADLTRFKAPILTIHNLYHSPVGSFPVLKDMTQLSGINPKDPKHPRVGTAEQSWITSEGDLCVVVDDGDEYRHPPVERTLQNLGWSVVPFRTFAYNDMSMVYGKLVELQPDAPEAVDSAAEEAAKAMLLTGRKTAVETAVCVARVGNPVSQAVKAVEGNLVWANFTRTRLQVKDWLARNQTLLVGGGILGLAVLLRTRKYWWDWVRPASVIAVNPIPWISSCIVSPVLEEAVLRPIIGWKGIVALESLRLLSGEINPIQLGYLAGFHYCFSQVSSTRKRILLHMAHNMVLMPAQTVEIVAAMNESISEAVPQTTVDSAVDIVKDVRSVVNSALTPLSELAKRFSKAIEDVTATGAIPWVHWFDGILGRMGLGRVPQHFTVEASIEYRENGLLKEGDTVGSVCVRSDYRDLPVSTTVKIYRCENPEPCVGSIHLQVVGPYLACQQPFIFRQCQHNKIASLWKRNVQPYKWETGVAVVDELAAASISIDYEIRVNKLVGQPIVVTDVMHSSDWIKRFPTSKWKLLREAHYDANRIPTNYSMFVKVEKQPLDKALELSFVGDDFAEAPMVKFDPRSIWCPRAETRYATGPCGMLYAHTLSQLLEQVTDETTGLRFVYPCGFDSEKLGRAVEKCLDTRTPTAFVFGDDILLIVWLDGICWFYELDASRQDHHMLKGIKYANINWFLALIPSLSKGSYLYWFWSTMFLTHDTLKLRSPLVSLDMNHGQSSGDPTTTGNGTTASCTCAAQFYEDVLKTGGEIRDDLVIFGVPFKAKRSQHLHDVTFLSKVFYPAMESGVGIIKPGPKIGRVLVKTFWHVGRLRKAKARAWLRGVAMGLVPDVAHIPILNTIVEVVLARTGDVLVREEHDPGALYKIRASSVAQPHPDIWSYLSCRYRLNVTVLHELDEECRRWDFGVALTHWAWEVICEVDC